MKKYLLPICTVALAVLFVGVQPAAAQDCDPALVDADPIVIAQNAAEAMTKMAAFCVEANAVTAERAVERITKLQDAGRPWPAFHAAKVSVTVITRRSNACVARIRARFQKTAQLLAALDAGDLIPRLRNLADQKVNEIRESQAAAIAAIREALPSVDDDAPAE